jgi:nitrate/TMAO reductase-like tetraheme cytochrome c subunit
VALLVVLGAGLGAGGWALSDVLEQDNDFCNRCHLSENVPLHEAIRHDFDGRPPANLAALHASHPVEKRPDSPAMRCIDCHGGVSWAGRARVKLLAAKDAFWWVTGRFDEPTHMASPLWDEDCRQCHERFDSSPDEYGNSPFHSLDVHNSALGVDCVECHTAHEVGGSPDSYFLQTAHIRRQCGRCHAEFEEDLQ